MKLLERIIYALYRKRKLLMIILAVGVVLYPVIAHAQGAPATQPQPETEEQITQNMQAYILVILRAMTAIFWPILMLIGGLLDNSLIFDGKMGETLLEIWVQVRNIVNIIFVVILVLIALYNVLGLGENGPESLKPLELKQALPKFVIALIVVNFSYIGMKVALDFTNVMTTAVFALPSQVVASSKNFQQFQAENEQIICEPDAPFYGLFCKSEKQEAEGTPPTFTRKFNDRGKAWFAQLDRSNLAVTMAMQFGQLPYANRIQDSVEGIFQLTFNIIFNLVLFIVFAISFIVLFIVLVARLPVLWLGIALSPVAALTLAFPPIKGLMGGEGGDFGKKFVQHAIAPLIIGVSLAIGYIMISAMKSDPGVHNGDFAVSLLDIDPNALITRIDDLQEVLMAAATIAVVWMGVFAAANNTIAKVVTDKIKSGAEGVGSFVAKLPMYMQVIPYKQGQPGIGLGNIMGSAQKFMRETMDKRTAPIGEELSPAETRVMEARTHTQLGDELHSNPGVIATSHGRVNDRIVELLEKIERLTDAEKEALQKYKSAAPSERAARMLDLHRVATTPELRRTLDKIVDDRSTFENRVNAASGEPGTPGEPRIINNYNEFTDTNLPRIISNPEIFAGKGLFDDLNNDETKELARRIQTFMSGRNGQAPSQTDFEGLKRDAQTEVRQRAAQTPATPSSGTPGTMPPTTPPATP